MPRQYARRSRRPRLRAGTSRIERIDAWRERGFGSQVAGVASVASEPPFERKLERFMGDTARFACHAATQSDSRRRPRRRHAALAARGRGDRLGRRHHVELRRGDGRCEHARRRKVPPYTVPHAMSSTASANVAQVFGLEGVSYSPSSACTTSALAIGQAMRLIQTGRQQIVLAGGSESLHDNMTLMFDAMGALSRRFNDTPRARVASLRQRARRLRDRVGRRRARARRRWITRLARGARIYAAADRTSASCTEAPAWSRRARRASRGAMRGALNEAGKRTGLHQHARAVHAAWRRRGTACVDASVRRGFGARHTRVFVDEGHDRASAWRLRRARGDLHAADDARRFHRGDNGDRKRGD